MHAYTQNWLKGNRHSLPEIVQTFQHFLRLLNVNRAS